MAPICRPSSLADLVLLPCVIMTSESPRIKAGVLLVQCPQSEHEPMSQEGFHAQPKIKPRAVDSVAMGSWSKFEGWCWEPTMTLQQWPPPGPGDPPGPGRWVWISGWEHGPRQQSGVAAEQPQHAVLPGPPAPSLPAPAAATPPPSSSGNNGRTRKVKKATKKPVRK